MIPSREDDACGPGVDGSRRRGRWALPSDREPYASATGPLPETALACESAPESVTILSRYGRRAEARLQDIADDLTAAGFQVTRADQALLTKDRAARRSARGSLLITAADPILAAPLAADLRCPLLLLDDIDSRAGLADRISRLKLETANLLNLRLDQRPRRSLLAECVIAPLDVTGTLSVAIDDGAAPITTPVLRAATTDTFLLAQADGRHYNGPPTMVGLYWRLDQPLADRMVPVGSRLVVRAREQGRQLTVIGDHDSFQAVATCARLGPNQVFTRARLP